MKNIYLPHGDSKISLKQYTLYYNSSDIWDYINKTSLQLGSSRRAFFPISSYESGGRIYQSPLKKCYVKSNSGIITRRGFVELSSDSEATWLFTNEAQLIKDFCACMEQDIADVGSCSHVFTVFKRFYEWKKKPRILYNYRYLSDFNLFKMFLQEVYPQAFSYMEELDKQDNQGEKFFSFLKMFFLKFHYQSSLSLKSLEKYEESIVEIEKFLKKFYLDEEKVLFLKDLELEAIQELNTSLKKFGCSNISQYEQSTVEYVRSEFEMASETAKSNQKVLKTNRILH